jgi:hypothetical protein
MRRMRRGIGLSLIVNPTAASVTAEITTEVCKSEGVPNFGNFAAEPRKPKSTTTCEVPRHYLMATLHAQEVETHGAGLGALGADAASLASSGKGFQLSFGSLVFQKLAAWLEIDSQTPPRSWTRSCQRSELPRSAVVAVQRQTVEGASPLSTQRQNFFSAVKRRRW